MRLGRNGFCLVTDSSIKLFERPAFTST